MLACSFLAWVAPPGFALRATGLEESPKERAELKAGLEETTRSKPIDLTSRGLPAVFYPDTLEVKFTGIQPKPQEYFVKDPSGRVLARGYQINQKDLQYEILALAPADPKQGSPDQMMQREAGTVVPAPPGGSSSAGSPVGRFVYQSYGTGFLSISVANLNQPAAPQEIFRVQLKEGDTGKIPALPAGSRVTVVVPSMAPPLLLESLGRVRAPFAASQAIPSDNSRFFVLGWNASIPELTAPKGSSPSAAANPANVRAVPLPFVRVVTPAPVTFPGLTPGRSLFSVFSRSRPPQELTAFLSQPPGPSAPTALQIRAGLEEVATVTRPVRVGQEPVLLLTTQSAVPIAKAVTELVDLQQSKKLEVLKSAGSPAGQGVLNLKGLDKSQATSKIQVFLEALVEPKNVLPAFVRFERAGKNWVQVAAIPKSLVESPVVAEQTFPLLEEIVPAEQAAGRIFASARDAQLRQITLVVPGFPKFSETQVDLENPHLDELEARFKAVGHASTGQPGSIRVSRESPRSSMFRIAPVVARPIPRSAPGLGAPEAVRREGVPEISPKLIFRPNNAVLSVFLPKGMERDVRILYQNEKEKSFILAERPELAEAAFFHVDRLEEVGNVVLSLKSQAGWENATDVDVILPSNPVLLRQEIEIWLGGFGWEMPALFWDRVLQIALSAEA